MNPTIEKLIEAVPNMVALIVVVYMFLKNIDRWNQDWREFIAKRDTDFQAFMSRERTARENEQTAILAALAKINDNVERVDTNLATFETYVKTAIEQMMKNNLDTFETYFKTAIEQMVKNNAKRRRMQ